MWHWGLLTVFLTLFESRGWCSTPSYDAQAFPSSSTHPHSKPNSNSWFSSLTRQKGKSVVRAADTHVQSKSIPDPPEFQSEIESRTSEVTTAAQPMPTPPQDIHATTAPQHQLSSWSSSPLLHLHPQRNSRLSSFQTHRPLHILSTSRVLLHTSTMMRQGNLPHLI